MRFVRSPSPSRLTLAHRIVKRSLNTTSSRLRNSDVVGRLTGISTRTVARVVAVFFLMTIVLGGVGESIPDRLVVPADAAATAARILAQTTLMRLGFATFMVELGCEIVTTVLFYELLKPVNRGISMLAAFFSLARITIKAISRLFFVTPLAMLGGADYLGVFSTEQLHTLSLFLLKVNAQGAGIAMIFLGYSAVLAGYLTLKSTFLPRALGAIGMLAGAGWLCYLSPPFADRAYPYVIVVALLGSAAKILWLLVFGVNEQRWIEQARTAASSMWA